MSRSRLWLVVISPRAERELARIPARDGTRIRSGIDNLAYFPFRDDLLKLEGRVNEWRLRVGDYRIRFAPDANARVIIVLRVHRRGAGYGD